MDVKTEPHERAARGHHEKQSRGETDEWYTPPEIFTALSLTFDLDPCAPLDLADSHVPATRHLTIDDDGLKDRWTGRVWLNPPYGPQLERWLRTLRYHGDGIALVPARTDTAWFHREVTKADAVCFVRGRISFLRPGGAAGRSPGFPSVLVAYGAVCADAVRNCGLGLITQPKEALSA